MTRDDDRQTLAEQAARHAENIEDWEPGEDTRTFFEDFGATDFGAEIDGDGTIRDAWIVIQPSSPRVEFSPHLSDREWWGTLTAYDNGNKHRTHVNDCVGMDWAAEEVRSNFRHVDGVEL